jgi:hypothetical protein
MSIAPRSVNLRPEFGRVALPLFVLSRVSPALVGPQTPLSLK